MPARSWKNFLVAVRDLDHPPRTLLTKAARIAQRFDGRLELLHVIAVPYLMPGVTEGTELAKEAEIARQLAKLERAAKRLRNVGLRVTCKVVWDYPAADAIVRHVLKSKPDVVLVESHHHSKVARWFVTHTDWELIRACPVPLWLVKTSKFADEPRVMAAIDPFHKNSKPAALDEEILRTARTAAVDRGRVGAIHVYPLPITMVAGGMGEPVWVTAPASDLRRARQRVTEAVAKEAERYDIKKTDRIVLAGDAASELPGALKKWKASLLVMGAVSRSGLRRVFIGNTAERAIDAVHCDVLVIKPRAFKTPVSRKPAAAVIPIPPM